jgi:hypothetical protein
MAPAVDDTLRDGVAHACKDDRDRPRLDDVGLQADQLLRERSYPIDVTAGPTKVDPHVAAIGPTQVRKRLREREELSLPQGLFSSPP